VLRGAVCFSGGKDSTAMLIRMLELGDYPIDGIFFADTEKEFPELYAYIKQIETYIQERFDSDLKIEFVHSKKTWDDWFYGEVSRGDNKGKVRGAPLRAYPCWWAREAKVIPLQRATKDFDRVFIGIAADESHRMTTQTDKQSIKNEYPLVEWGWSEQDCFDYLDNLELMNDLYVNFNRLGCFHCIKQPATSWWSLWSGFPELWEEAKRWDEESVKVTTKDWGGGHGLRSMEPGKDGWLLSEMEQRFKDGWIPKGKTKFDCESCDAVRFVAQGQMTLADFEGADDNAHERMGLIDQETPACDITWIKDDADE
jgi:3'-phosphoadenosine 5'-phosphosulfate sulfotransferase (PAPS reductase)/FAD synthetase